jgi:hypothetical protein
MKIKKYTQFIKESQDDFHSLGEWVENLIDDEYVRNIISRYTKDSKPDVNLANAINILDDITKSEIRQQLENYIKNGIEDKDPEVSASTDIEGIVESSEFAGKGIFSSFMKSITALGHKEMTPNWEKCPNDYLIFYYYQDLDAQMVKQVFERFKSLVKFSGMIDYGKNEVSLFYGIKCDGTFEYGVSYDDKLSKMGHFKLSQSVVRWIIEMQIISASSLKKELVNLTYFDITTLGKIKSDMIGFDLGYHEKKSFPTIKDKIITFGYYGVGKWENGKLDNSEFLMIKNKFTNWVLSKKWGSKVLVSVHPQSFWIYIHIKLK